MTIRVTVWGENVHEQTNELVSSLYPKGMHSCIAEALAQRIEHAMRALQSKNAPVGALR